MKLCLSGQCTQIYHVRLGNTSIVPGYNAGIWIASFAKPVAAMVVRAMSSSLQLFQRPEAMFDPASCLLCGGFDRRARARGRRRARPRARARVRRPRYGHGTTKERSQGSPYWAGHGATKNLRAWSEKYQWHDCPRAHMPMSGSPYAHIRS